MQESGRMPRPDPNGPADRRPIKVGEVWENPATGERATILELPWDNPAGRGTGELTALVGARVMGEHRHPTLVERFTVLQGELTVKRNEQTSVLRPGETAVVEPSVWHDWWNASERDARVRVEVTPGERFLHMIETFFGLARLGRVNRKGMPSPLQLALTAVEFSDIIVFRVAATGCAARDLWRTHTDSTLARLSRDIPAALARRAGAADVSSIIRLRWPGILREIYLNDVFGPPLSLLFSLT